MGVVRYKIPSQAASGADTFSDSLVGNQITDGSSQLTNTNFAVDKVIPEKDSKDFKTNPFSDYVTLDTIKEEDDVPTTQYGNTKKEKISFKGKLDDASKSLFGSLKNRLSVSIGKIISKFPAGILIDENSSIKITNYTAFNSVYSGKTNTTEFYVPQNILFNPFDITLIQPLSNTLPTTDNTLRNFYSSFKKYTIEFSGNTYDIINYTEPNGNGDFKLKVNGNIFNGTTGTTTSFLIRPNDAITEEFFNNLDDLEKSLLNRETTPKYTATFKVPRDSFDETSTDIVNVTVNWPISKDNWNLQIVGINYNDYVSTLSSLGDEIDDYKSNLIVRFLTAPQLFEFDTEEKRAESIFQLYGQSFDRVKKYIENIAYMRNVSYDGINNVPDILLKNLSNTLGLSTVNLFDEKSLQDTLYTRQDAQYLGLPVGKTLIEAEYEFYRRILTNLAHLYKSKGTRSAIEFFLKFLGAPEPLIMIDEYVYKVTDIPHSLDIESDIYDLIQGTKTQTEITGVTLSSGVFSAYVTGITTGSTTLVRDEYPIDDDGYPRKTTNAASDIYFQKGAGWYDLTLDHRSSNIINTELSILTGRTKTIKTKPKPYTYGEDYFNYFRTLPGLDYGFKLESHIDNKKISVVDVEKESKLTLNRKNLNVYLSPARGIEYDVYRKSRDLDITFGQLTPQNDYSFAEFLDSALSQVITNSNVVKYQKNYVNLEEIYNSYLTNKNGTSTGYTPYNFVSVYEFVQKMTPYWTQLVEQFIPSSTLWTGGNLVENNIFNRSKYDYKTPRYGVQLPAGVAGYDYDIFYCIDVPPTPTPTNTVTPTVTPTITPTNTVTPTITPTVTVTTTAAPVTPSNTPTTTPTPTITPTITKTPTPTPRLRYQVELCEGSGGNGTQIYNIEISLSVTVGKTYTLLGTSGLPASFNGKNCWKINNSNYNNSYDGTATYYNEYAACGNCTPVFFDAYTGSTVSAACDNITLKRVYYRGSLGLSYDTVLYTNSGFTQTVDFGYYWYSSELVFGVLNTQLYPSVEDGRINYETTCPPLTPTPTPSPVPVAVSPTPMALSYGSTGPAACSGSSGTINIYYATTDSNPGTLSSGHTYYNSNGFAYDGSGQTYWSDGENYYGTISSSGYYQQQGTCE